MESRHLLLASLVKKPLPDELSYARTLAVIITE